MSLSETVREAQAWVDRDMVVSAVVTVVVAWFISWVIS